jgi:hypothetical protein
MGKREQYITMFWYFLWILTYVITFIVYLQNKQVFCNMAISKTVDIKDIDGKKCTIEKKTLCNQHKQYKNEIKKSSTKNEWGDLLYSNKVFGFIVSLITFYMYYKNNNNQNESKHKSSFLNLLLVLYFLSAIMSFVLVSYIFSKRKSDKPLQDLIVQFDDIMGYVTMGLGILIIFVASKLKIKRILSKISKI